MSFILDALRKSDAERQRTATPGLADVRYARRSSRRNLWLPLLVVVLLGNIVFMGVQWFGRHDQPAAPAIPAISEPDAGTPQSGPSVDRPAADNVRPLARENEFGELRPAYTAAPEPAPSPQPEPAPAAAAPPAPAKAPAAADDPYPRITPEKSLPSIEQVIGEGKLAIPALNLDLHVYSDTPARRFVVINSHRYREGDRLAEGPVVERITADGVILDNQGLRFTLARK